jgi:hypothetical protein
MKLLLLAIFLLYIFIALLPSFRRGWKIASPFINKLLLVIGSLFLIAMALILISIMSPFLKSWYLKDKLISNTYIVIILLVITAYIFYLKEKYPKK